MPDEFRELKTENAYQSIDFANMRVIVEITFWLMARNELWNEKYQINSIHFNTLAFHIYLLIAWCTIDLASEPVRITAEHHSFLKQRVHAHIHSLE